MVDAIVGGVIMVVATSSLFLAIEVAEKAMQSAGRFCLTNDEKEVLIRAGLSKTQRSAFWSENFSNALRYVSEPESTEMLAEECE